MESLFVKRKKNWELLYLYSITEGFPVTSLFCSLVMVAPRMKISTD